MVFECAGNILFFSTVETETKFGDDKKKQWEKMSP